MHVKTSHTESATINAYHLAATAKLVAVPTKGLAFEKKKKLNETVRLTEDGGNIESNGASGYYDMELSDKWRRTTRRCGSAPLVDLTFLLPAAPRGARCVKSENNVVPRKIRRMPLGDCSMIGEKRERGNSWGGIGVAVET